MELPRDRPLLRIGELSRRLGVSDHMLRAWENRYGLLQPVRSPGGFRLNSEADERRIRRMQAYLADGLSAAEAARTTLGGDAITSLGYLTGPRLTKSAGSEPSARLRQALDAFDVPAAQAVLDRLLADLSVPAVLRDVVLPYRADLGERWQGGTASVALEHFASNLIRGRLAGLARGSGSGHGPQALLARPPGSCTIWRSWFSESRSTATAGGSAISGRTRRPRSWSGPPAPRVLTRPSSPPPSRRPSSRSARSSAHSPGAPLALAGAGATAQIATATGARLLTGDPVTEAGQAGWPR
jgi:hypothetical protein